MEKDGWIKGEVIYQIDNPSKRVFSLTGTGRAEFAKWFREEPELPSMKHLGSKSKEAVLNKGGEALYCVPRGNP